MDRILASFITGSLLSLFFPLVPAFFCFIILMFLCLYWFMPKAKPLLTAFLFGFSYCLCFAFSYQQKIEQLQTKGHSLLIEVVAKVNNLTPWPITKDTNNIRYELQIINVIHGFSNQLSQYRLRVSANNQLFPFKQGQTLKCWLKIKPAHGLANIGGFNYQQWLRSQNIHATGYIVPNKPCTIWHNKVSLRQQWRDKYAKLIQSLDYADIIRTLTFADKSALSQAHQLRIQQAGLQHLMAISGLHLAIVFAWLMIFWGIVIPKTSTFLSQLMANKGWVNRANWRISQYFFSFVAVVFYSYLAGFSAPTVRALLMLAMWLIANHLQLNWSITRWLLLSLGLLILFEPLALLSLSFWLSYVAVIVIFGYLWLIQPVSGSPTFIQKAGYFVGLQLSLTLLLSPILVSNFGQLSTIGVLVNLVAVPLFSLLVIPLSLASVLISSISTDLSMVLAQLVDSLLRWFWYFLDWLTAQLSALYQLSALSLLYWMSLLVVSLLFMLIWRKLTVNLKAKVVCLILIPVCLTGMSYPLIKSKSDDLWQLYVLDVGQGSSVLLVKGKHAILYDTGASYPSGFNMADNVILPVLAHLNINELDHLIISHNDNDHAGSLAQLQQQISIKQLWYNQTLVPPPNNQQHCVAGKLIVWQQLTLRILSPKQVNADLNQDSCVIVVSDGTHQVLLTGDIDTAIEFLLTKQYPALTADILLAPHHGSKTSSSLLFLKQLAPKYAVFSTGFYNQWRMPNQQVMERYQQLGIQQFNTAEHGMVVFDINQQQIMARTMRDDLWHYWFAN